MTDRNLPPDDFDPFDDLIAEEMDTSDRLSASPSAIDRNRVETGNVDPRPDRARFGRGRRSKPKRDAKPKPDRRANRRSEDDDAIDMSLLDDTDDSDELLAELERGRRGGRTGDGVDIGALIGGALEVVITAVLLAAIMLFIGAGVVFGGRALGVIPGGALNLSGIVSGGGALSSVPPTQPAVNSVAVAPTLAEAQPVASAPTADPGAGAALPTTAATEPIPPSATPIPECRPQDVTAWWALQADNYATFSAITPETIVAEANPAAYYERLRLRREFSAAARIDGLDEGCIAGARAALLEFIDATLERVRVLTALNGIDPNALNAAETRLIASGAAMTTVLWEVGALVEADSPVAAGLARGSGEACGAAAWFAQVDAIWTQFDGFAVQIDVISQPASTVRELITNMQAVAANADALTVPECAQVPNALRGQIMQIRAAAYESLLRGQSGAAEQAFTRADVAMARYEAWRAWLLG